jgi:predicted Zn-dependent protease
MTVARVSLVALAVCACAWFGLGAVQSHATDEATSIVLGAKALTQAQGAHARSLLDTAATLNPDHGIDLLRAQLAVDEGRWPAAIGILHRALAAEPMNLQGWLALAHAALGHDQHVVKQTLSHLAALDPKLR